MLSFSCSVVSYTLWPHGLQHARLPCPSLSPGVCSNSCPLNQWYHPTISSSVIPFSSCLQSFPASGSFLMIQFWSGGHSIESFSMSFSDECSQLISSLVAQMVENWCKMQKTQVWFLGGEDTLDKEMATHSSILNWRIPWTEQPGRLKSKGL